MESDDIGETLCVGHELIEDDEELRMHALGLNSYYSKILALNMCMLQRRYT